MAYNPQPESRLILDRALRWIHSVPYATTARWVFYRLLQDGTYSGKKGYHHLLGLTSKARKAFYGEWRPWTLADDTRAPVLLQRQGYYGLHLRGDGFKSESEWLGRLREEINCPLDRWAAQPVYAEAWFEAAAMLGQFLYYADENIPLLAFHGDISIPEKWRAAERLAKRYLELRKPVHIYYFGDYDPKGLSIPLSAWDDIGTWAAALMIKEGVLPSDAEWALHFHRVGINADQIKGLKIQENPERPKTYQWEALDDSQARQLIERANEYLDIGAFRDVAEAENFIGGRLKEKIG